jgi:transcriptional regulator GlxA family with amidase domain
MSNSVDSNLTVNEIALKVGISTRSLQLGFKRFKNTTPMAFLRSARLQTARKLLLSPHYDKSIRELSFECGFSNHQLFIKYYVETYGERPSDTINLIKKAPPSKLKPTKSILARAVTEAECNSAIELKQEQHDAYP